MIEWENIGSEEFGPSTWDEFVQRYIYGCVTYSVATMPNGNRLYRSRVIDSTGYLVSESISAIEPATRVVG